MQIFADFFVQKERQTLLLILLEKSERSKPAESIILHCKFSLKEYIR